MSDNINYSDLSKQVYVAVHKTNNEIDINNIINLLTRGASLTWTNNVGKTALHIAARYGHVECIQLFLQNGALLNAKDKEGLTPLHYAAQMGQLECCKFLVQHSADVRITDNRGTTPILFAASNGHVDCCKYFLDRGIEVNIVDNDGDTPLHVAATHGNLVCCQLLKEHGGDFNIKNNNGLTPILCLLRYSETITDERLKICKYIFQCGAFLNEIPEIMNSDEHKERYKSLQTCWAWWYAQQKNRQHLIDIPVEVFNRGSEAIDIYINEIENSRHRIYRSRVCVVGPSGWGKTSLVKSLISGVPEHIPEDERTIGIDRFQWSFNIRIENGILNEEYAIEYSSLNSIREIEKHQVSFWDFAGQDIYKGAHSIFFSSSRTLFFICVDLQECDDDIGNDRNTASDKILQWVQLVFTKQPCAKLVFVGTKADCVDPNTIQIIKSDISTIVKEWCNNYINNIEKSEYEMLVSENNLKRHLEEVKVAVCDNWVITSSKKKEVLNSARIEIKSQISKSNIGFIMPDTYTSVLEYLHQLKQDARPNSYDNEEAMINNNQNISCENLKIAANSQLNLIFCSQQQLKQKILNKVGLGNYGLKADFSGHEHRLLDEILGLFNDLGEILIFNDIVLNKRTGIIIVDPELMIDLVREIVRHNLCEYLDCLNNESLLEPSNWKEELKNGVVCHTILCKLPIWRDLTIRQQHAAKELLHQCRILHPIGSATLISEKNVIVPALWLINQDKKSNSPEITALIERRYQNPHSVLCLRWEYDFCVNTLPDSFFERFVVESYSYCMERKVQLNSLEVWVPDTQSVGLVTFLHHNSNHSIIRIDVASNIQDMEVQLLQYFLSAIENVLHEYPGLSQLPFYVDMTSNIAQKRHGMNGKFLLERFCLTASYSSLDESLFLWYYKLFSKDHKDLPKLLEMCEQRKIRQSQTDDKASINLLRFFINGEKNRQLPALWTAEVNFPENKLRIRLLSDISGKCFHDPIVLPVPLRLLSKYKNKLKIGENVLSIVTPDAIPSAHLDISNKNEQAKYIYNLIQGCALRPYGITDTDPDSRMDPEQSKLFLMDLLNMIFPNFTLDQIPQMSNLVCGYISRTGHRLWATQVEFGKFTGGITRF